MKRTGIFALAATCALGVTALVGGVGYASALDVAEQAGQTLALAGVSTVEATSQEVADSTSAGKNKGTPTTEPTDPATETPVEETPVDDGTVDEGSGDEVDVVDPSDPVVIPDDGTKDPTGHKNCGKGSRGDVDGDGVKDPAVEGGSSWSGKHDDAATDPATKDAEHSDDSARENSNRSWGGGNSDRSDRGGDRGQRGGGHGNGGGGHHGGRG